ncbi:MAG TPA: cation:proton antiporter, partial [Terracidiphilus sp.]|nr:cation:proton antiporter [Terracidiphilus sp.]
MTTLEILSVLFAIAALFGMISTRWLKLPITVGTMLLTVLASVALIGAGQVAPQFHWWALSLVQRIDFESVILHGMLPLLLFAGAFLLDLEQLAREKLTVSLLSVVGTVLSVFLVAGLMSLLTGIRIPWMQCLIFGALISPTDPIAVLEMLRRTGVPKSIQAQLAGESLFNDGLGAVLFLTMLEVARGQAPTPLHIAEFLLLKAGGGIAVGILAAWVTSHLMRRVHAYQVDILFTIALALGSYVLADVLHLSAPLEAVVAGIAMRHFNRNQPKERIDHDSVDGFWELIDEIQNSVLFVLLGLEIMA